MIRAWCLALLLISASSSAHAAQPQLEVSTQALGWWMSSSGAISVLAGVFALAAPRPIDDGSGRDLQLAGGISLAGLGIALFTVGVLVLTTGEPGPCETSGTALGNGPSSQPSDR